MIKRQAVVVRWTDSEGTSSWTSRQTVTDDFAKPMPEIVSCGFLWHNTRHHVSIYQSHDTKNDVFDHLLRIPRCAVIEVKKL